MTLSKACRDSEYCRRRVFDIVYHFYLMLFFMLSIEWKVLKDFPKWVPQHGHHKKVA